MARRARLARSHLVIYVMVIAFSLSAGITAGATQGSMSFIWPSNTDCPKYEKSSGEILTSVTMEQGSVAVNTTAKVELTGVEPSAPEEGYYSKEFSQLVLCLFKDTGTISQSSWFGGVAKFEVHLNTAMLWGRGDPPEPHRLTALQLGVGDGLVTLRTCADEAGCIGGLRRRISVAQELNAGSFDPQLVRPSPNLVETKGEAYEYSWNERVTGPVSVEFKIPPREFLASAVSSAPDQSIPSVGVTVRANPVIYGVLPSVILLCVLILFRSPVAISASVLLLIAGMVITTVLQYPQEFWHQLILVGLLLELAALTRRLAVGVGAFALGLAALGIDLVASQITALVLAIVVLGLLFLRSLDALEAATPRSQGVRLLGVAAVTGLTGFTLGHLAGSWWSAVVDHSAELRVSFLDPLTQVASSGYLVAKAIPIIIAGSLILAVLNVEKDELIPDRWTAGLVALLVAVGSPSADSGLIHFGVPIPVWLLGLLALQVGISKVYGTSIHTRSESPAQLLDRCLHPIPVVGLSGSDRTLSPTRITVRFKPEAGPTYSVGAAQRGLFERLDFMSPSWRDEAREAAFVGMILGALPTGSLFWNILSQLGKESAYVLGPWYLALSVAAEAVRWVALSVCFGALFRLLPGRIGPVKGLALAAFWSIGALFAGAVVLISGGDVSTLLYRVIQVFLFLVALGLVKDTLSLRRAGGSWWDLRSAYRLENFTKLIAAIAPIGLLAIALAQQIASGSPLDLASVVLNGLASVLK